MNKQQSLIGPYTASISDLLRSMRSQPIQVTQASGSLPRAASGVFTSVITVGLPRLAVDKIFLSVIQVA
jgi:hypothetical protein